MDYIIRVREAINKKVKNLLSCLLSLLMLSGICLLSLLMLSVIAVIVIHVRAIIDHLFIEAGIVLIFSMMIFEDFIYKTIDMRAFTILLFFMSIAAVNLIQFIYLFLIGLLIFRVLFLSTTKIIVPIKSKEIDTESKKSIVFGYLPILGLSWGVYEFFLSHLSVPGFFVNTHEGFQMLKEIILNDFFMAGLAIGLLFLVWVLQEYRLHKAKKEQKLIIYGFGDGDVFVLAGFLAYLGVEPLIIIFFISLLLQIGYYCFIYFLRGVLKNEM